VEEVKSNVKHLETEVPHGKINDRKINSRIYRLYYR